MEQEASDQKKQHISKERLEDMKQETYILIRRFCKPEGSHRHYGLYLHDKTYVEFTKSDSDEIEKFCGLVEKIAKVINVLIPKLSYESDTQYPVTEYVTGSIDFEKTRILRQIENKKLVCIQYSKNLFTYENVLLAAVILGINTMAMQYLQKKAEWQVSQSQTEVYVQKLDGIISLTGFWLKDRNVSKLTNNYYQNFQGIEYLLEKTLYRFRIGKIAPKYHPLIQFIRVWKKYGQILNADDTGLEIALSSLEHFRTDNRTYEIWIFYKMLELFFNEPRSKPVEQQEKDPHVFTKGKYTIKYQFRKYIEWEKDGTELFRIPDTVIKKDSKIIAMFDAKYMKSGDKLETAKPDDPPDMPDRNIVNQMIIAMDYGKARAKTDIGIVLFADDRTQSTVVIEKGPKKIYFLNMHPANNPENALAEVKNIIDVK